MNQDSNSPSPSHYAVVEVGYTKYVMPLEDGVKLVQILASAEVYDTERPPPPIGGDRVTVHFIKPQNMNGPSETRLRVMSRDFYNACKLAGEQMDKAG